MDTIIINRCAKKIKIKACLFRDGGKYPDVLKGNPFKYFPALVALPDQVPKPTSEPVLTPDPDKYHGSFYSTFILF